MGSQQQSASGKSQPSAGGTISDLSARASELARQLAEARAQLTAFAAMRERLAEVEETMRAIQNGEVDALVVNTKQPGEQVFTLSSADRPYRIFIENMREGAVTLSVDGVILFANPRLIELLNCQLSEIIARPIHDFMTAGDAAKFQRAVDSHDVNATVELTLRRPGGGTVATLVGVSRLEIDSERLTCLTFTDLTSEHLLLSQVRASQQRFRALYKNSPVATYTWERGPSGLLLVGYNDAAVRLSGAGLRDALGGSAAAYYGNDEASLANLARCLESQEVIELETVRAATATDARQQLKITLVPVPPGLVVEHKHDISEQWASQQALRTSEERYRTIVENAHEGISILDAEGRFTFANRRLADLLGFGVDALRGVEASSILGSIAQWQRAPQNMDSSAVYAVKITRPDATTVDLLVSTAPILLADSEESGSLCMVSDVSGLRDAEDKLAYWALHDPLTGLPNRNLLVDRIDTALARLQRDPGTVAALFCDVDGFKDVNDSLGHHIGDEVLRAIAARLQAAVRPADTVARIGGDEFVVLCERLVDANAAFAVASRVLAAVAVPLEIAGHELILSISVGVAFASSTDPAELMSNADAAMYLAKQRGRNRAELFDEQLRMVAADRLTLISDLRHALHRDELRLHYQPVFTLDGELLLGVEALVRWQHPQYGLLFPDAFIPVAESVGLIADIGAWVLKAACAQAARWSRAGPGGSPLHMAVNVSARQLVRGGDLVELVAKALDTVGIEPSTLILEVTESAVMDDAEATLTVLQELKGLGVQLAIDDFGTGYSSLMYLKRFPVDQLKIDRTFVSGLSDDPDDSAIVASVVRLAEAVGIVAVAEGVETREQLIALQHLGCSFGQGYYWSKARPADVIDDIIARGAFPVPVQRGNDVGLNRAMNPRFT